MTDNGSTDPGTAEPYKGAAGDALANQLTIRIYNKNGIYYDSPYYRNMGFISRYRVDDDFRGFLSDCINE